MPINTIITGTGDHQEAEVTSRGALKVSVVDQPAPEVGSENVYRAFNKSFSNMNVDGSGNPVEFVLTSSAEYDILIKSIMILTVDGSITANKFGAISALSNGVDLIFTESGDETFLLDKAKTTGSMTLQVGVDEVKTIPNFLGSDDGHPLLINIYDLYNPDGFRIGRDSLDTIKFVVNDAITALSDLRIYFWGRRQYPS